MTAQGERPERESWEGSGLEVGVKGSRGKPPKGETLELRAVEEPASVRRHCRGSGKGSPMCEPGLMQVAMLGTPQ